MGEARNADLRRTARLLAATFGGHLFDDERYLRWFYDENPHGPAIEEHLDDGEVRVAHLAGIPQVYHRRGQTLPVVFPLHIAVAPAARGGGLMTKLSQQCFADAWERRRVRAFVGMPNRNSTPGYTGRLGFRLVRPLPVRICLPIPALGTGMRSVRVTSEYLSSPDFAAASESVNFEPGDQWAQAWSPELLRWRLAAPHAQYALHISPGLLAVSCRTQYHRVPFAVILKCLAPRAVRISGSTVVSAACRFHRAPLAIYAGFNARIQVRGFPLPQRLRPAPLNLIFRSLDAAVIPQDDFVFETFEFLDFDAY